MLTPRELNVMSTASVLLRAKCGFPDGLYTLSPFSCLGKKFWMSRRVFDQMLGGFFGH